MAPEETDLDRLIRVAEHHARMVLVTQQNALTPLFHLICPGAYDLIVATPFRGDTIESKDAVAQAIRELIRENGATAYMFVSEAWMILRPSKDVGEERPTTAKDRIEVVVAIATDGVDHKHSRWRIMRNKKGKCVDLALDSTGEDIGDRSGLFDNLFTRH